MLNQFIINVSLLISLIFMYVTFRRKLGQFHPSPLTLYLYDGVSGGLMGYVLMNFSILLVEGTFIDFRYIPIILIFLFIDNKAAILSALLIAAARFFIGISISSYFSILILSLLILGLYVIKYFARKIESIYLKGMIMVIYATFLYTLYFINLLDVTTEIILILVFFWLVSILGGLFALFLMNYLRTAELLVRKYEAEATIDYLTGLSNVRKFYLLLDYYTKKSKAKESPLAIAMLDIDFFKRVNDTYGHEAGDIVLIEVARILEEAVDSDAFIFRKGGEEFTAIFPNTSLEKVVHSMEACRKAIESHIFNVGQLNELHITISIGICHFSETTTSVDDVMANADEKLYVAKERGRNRLVY